MTASDPFDALTAAYLHPSGVEITDDVFARSDTISVAAVAMPVMAPEDILAIKLHALNEHSLDGDD